MTTPARIDARTVKSAVSAGTALLVCAYPKNEKFLKNHLEGAISLLEFEERLPALAKEQEMFFYCA